MVKPPKFHDKNYTNKWWYSYCPDCTALYWTRFGHMKHNGLRVDVETSIKDESYAQLNITCPICGGKYLMHKVIHPIWYLPMDRMHEIVTTKEIISELKAQEYELYEDEIYFYEIDNSMHEYHQNIAQMPDENDIEYAIRIVK